jgi:hypothetical protein
MRRPIPGGLYEHDGVVQMDYLEGLKDKWPSDIVSRSEIYSFTGGAIRPGTMANADCDGTGPKESFFIGRKVVYPVSSVIDWLRERSTAKQPKEKGFLSW